MKKILLTGKYSNSHHALVDDDIVLPKGKWTLTWNGYAIKAINKKITGMHHWIMGTPKGMDTDHINGNRLDNRRSNLQVCSKSQNHAKAKLQKNNLSGFRGVHWFKPTQRWRVSIMFNKKNIHVGYFKDIVKAAKAYDIKAKELFGKFAILNLI